MSARDVISGIAMPLPVDDVDTDALYPARFYTLPGRFDQALFANWRTLRDGTLDPAFPLNDPRYSGACVLIGGANFGCGSSRENAVWALQDAGFQAVVASSFGEIFAGNAGGCGLACLTATPDDLAALHANPGIRDGTDRLQIDLATGGTRIDGADGPVLTMDATARSAILSGDLPLDLAIRRATASSQKIQNYRSGARWLPGPFFDFTGGPE